jgi:ribonuclease R
MAAPHFFITGYLSFSPKKVILESGGISYFVRLRSLNTDSYLHGDYVRARIMKKHDSSHLAEVDIISRIKRTEGEVLWRLISRRNHIFLESLPEQWSYSKQYTSLPLGYWLDEVVVFIFDNQGHPHIRTSFWKGDEFDIEEKILFHLAGVKLNFDTQVQLESEQIEKMSCNQEVSRQFPWRMDFRDWYTFTIDGSDAKDLDDAISLRKLENGNYLLAVHIADVSEYVSEWSVIDREAYRRTTSIYTPGKVVPMLPEILSNQLCSLSPGTEKLTLSCIMEINRHGSVVHTDIVESVIVSQHRWVYEAIEETHLSLWYWVHQHSLLQETILLGYELYEIIQLRRKREGKILFESTELRFELDTSHAKEKIIPKNVSKRVRTNAHKLIEEFMVLANEEVAKWCENNNIPFLSRIHSLPGNDQMKIIEGLIGHRGITPHSIRKFLDSLSNERDLYRYSRLLLPKMAKAHYSDKRSMHFWLALEYYAHFTSPIRRYPDLQIHRIIKEKINNRLTPERRIHYKTILGKVARHCSLEERKAEDVARVFDALYACRFMEQNIWQIYGWRIAWITEFAIFIELENGIEWTLYLPRRRYRVNAIEWTLETLSGKIEHSIGDDMKVIILQVDMNERRIILQKTL